MLTIRYDRPGVSLDRPVPDGHLREGTSIYA